MAEEVSLDYFKGYVRGYRDAVDIFDECKKKLYAETHKFNEKFVPRRRADGMTKGAHSKGKAKEREFCEWLMSVQPDIIAWTPPMGKYTDNDIFGVFDVVCVNSRGGVVFLQLCHPNSIHAHLDKIGEWYRVKGIPVAGELWTYDKTGFRRVTQWLW